MTTHRHHTSSHRLPPPGSEQEPDDVIDDFRRGRELGKGSFATVYLVQHRKRKSFAAVKAVQQAKLSSKLKSNLEKEITILKDLRHPHIVALFTVKETPLWYYLVMEYCQLSDLSQFLKKRHQIATLPETRDIFHRYPNPEHGGLHEVLSRHFIKQIASALQYLRSQNLMHRDIKPQNMLLNPSPVEMSKWQPDDVPLAASEYSLVPAVGVQTLPMLKIADFGFARHLPSTSMAETLCGSPLYMAPEILRYEKYESRADLWSTGAVLYEMVVGKPPFRAQNHVELLRRIERANDVITFDNKNMTISRGSKDLIRKLLKKSPLVRCSWEEFFEDPVITGDIPGLLEQDRPYLISKNMTVLPDTHLSRRMAKQAFDSPEQARSPAEGSAQPLPIPTDQTADRELKKPPSTEAVNNPDLTRRRSSTGVQAQPEPSGRELERRPSQRDPAKARRPSIVAHTTAPARQDLHVGSAPPSGARMERRASRTSPLAGPPMVRESSAVEIERKAAQERTAQDVAFEKEYVMIEKRAVEINAFADQLEIQSLQNRSSPQSQGIVVRRATSQGQTSTGLGGTSSSPSRAISNAVSRPGTTHQRAGSFERRYAPSPQSATNMLTKALTAANFRLFGGVPGTSPPFGKGPSPPSGYSAFPVYPAPQSALLLGDGQDAKAPVDEDSKLVRTMEEAASRSDVIYGFADVKFRQLIPAMPSAPDALGIQPIGAQERPVGEEEDDEDRDMTNVAIVGVSEEALVLFVKTLAILAKIIDLAGYWWTKNNRGDGLGSPVTSRPSSASGLSEVGKRLNGIVQWARERFNDCLEKSEITARRLQAAQHDLPLDHPGHPSNHTAHIPNTSPAAAGPNPSAITASAEQIHITSGITAEKLMFDRAVEMSRNAALSELVGKSFDGCEIMYMTAILLLEALLEGDDEPLSRRPRASKAKTADAVINGMETEDRQMVIKLVDSARSRLTALRKKLHVQQQQQQKAARRTSLSAAGSVSATSKPAGHGQISLPITATATPALMGTPPR